MASWALAGLVASIAAVILASFASIAPAQFGLYAVPALGAALAGRFRNLWIVCALEYRGRWLELWAPGRYTLLFFHDEAVSLAAGHRP